MSSLIPDEFAAFLDAHSPPDCAAARSKSMGHAFERLATSGGQTIVELGAILSFVHA